MVKVSFSCNVYYGSVRKLLFQLQLLKLKIHVIAVFEKVLKKRLWNQDRVRDYL